MDLVWIPPWISQVEYLWSEPSLERVMARLTEFARVITFDRRGSGLSDPALRSAHPGGPDGRRAGRDGRGRVEERGDLRHARGRPDGLALRRDLPGAHQRAGPLRHLRPRHVGARLRVGVARRDARRPHGRRALALGRGLDRRLGGAEPAERPILHGVGRPPGASGREPRNDPPHLRTDRRLRRARRAALDPRADARDAPDRGQLPEGRALALHRVADPGRPLRGARGRRQHVLDRATPKPCSGRSRSF